MIVTNVICGRCNNFLGVAFENVHETWGEMLAHLEVLGFAYEGGPGQCDVKITRCPTCRAVSDERISEVARVAQQGR